MTANFYCACCLRTRAFVANERGFQCPVCRKVLIRPDPPRRRPWTRVLARAATVVASVAASP